MATPLQNSFHHDVLKRYKISITGYGVGLVGSRVGKVVFVGMPVGIV